MKEAEQQRIQLLRNQIMMMVGDTLSCVQLMKKGVDNNTTKRAISLKSKDFGFKESPFSSIDKLEQALNDISQALDVCVISSSSEVGELTTKIENLEDLNCNFGFYLDHNETPMQGHHLIRDVQAKEKTTLKQLSDTLVYCVRAVLRLVDNIVHTIPWSKNYNEQGETPLAVSITGKTQFFPRPTSSVYVALKELQKANGVLKETLEHLSNDDVNTPNTPS